MKSSSKHIKINIKLLHIQQITLLYRANSLIRHIGVFSFVFAKLFVELCSSVAVSGLVAVAVVPAVCCFGAVVGLFMGAAVVCCTIPIKHITNTMFFCTGTKYKSLPLQAVSNQGSKWTPVL